MQRIYFLLLGVLTLFTPELIGQSTRVPDDRVNLVFGLSQLMLGGFNVEGNYAHKRLIFDYSHGIGLTLDNAELEAGADRDQSLSVYLPWTTGFGVGYRFNDWLNLRAEPKWHRFELYEAANPRATGAPVGEYTTFTFGLGLYANLRPFKNHDNFLSGIMVAPNARWWPRVSSSLNEDTLTYINATTESTETHQARQIGMGNTPFFVNVSVGYSVAF